MRPATLILLASLAGCSLSSEGLGAPEDPFLADGASGAADSGVRLEDTTAASEDTASDSGDLPDGAKPDTAPVPDSAKPDTAKPDTGPPCVESACGANPTFAKRIGLVDRTVPCPAGFVSTDVQEVREGDACSCSCSTTGFPTCPGAGSVPTFYSDAMATCGTTGATLTSAGNALCSSTPGSGSLHKYFRGTPIPATGGMCGTTVVADKLSASRPRRICEAVTCGAPICATPFVECIEAATCGGAFPVSRVVGSDVNVTCPACSCAVSGTCAAAITFYGNGDCTGNSVSVAATDICALVPTGGPATVSSFRYATTLTSAACTAGYMKSKGTPVVTGQRSLCCRG